MVQTTTGKRTAIDESTLLIPSADAAPVVRPLGAEPYRFVFRSAPGKYLGDLEHSMDCPDPKWDEPDDDPASRRWARFAKANWKERNPDEKVQTALAEAFMANGGSRIVKFRYHIGAHGSIGTVTLGTDSDAIATVIRADIRRGKIPFVTEIDQSRYVKVGNKAYANTDFGRALAYDDLAKNGGSLELVEKD